MRCCTWFALACVFSAIVLARQTEPISPEALQAAIDQLGTFEYEVRMNAGRTVRRAPPALAVPALVQAASGHSDGYVRFRALVLLSAFNDRRGRAVMLQEVDDPNDRLREVVYAYLEHNPGATMVPRLLAALEHETSEFVRPALIRALAAHDDDPDVRQTLLVEVDRGQDFFRSTVIEALGDYRAEYAVAALARIANLGGPLQDDAVLALGKVGNAEALGTLAALQRSAPDDIQPAIASAICLLGVNCATHVEYVNETLQYATDNVGHQSLLRSAAVGLAALAVSGRMEALTTLFDVGGTSNDPARAPIALAVGTVALRNTDLVLAELAQRSDLEPALALLREAFDMLEEDFEEERFFAAVRRAYWDAGEGSRPQLIAESLIQQLEF